MNEIGICAARAAAGSMTDEAPLDPFLGEDLNALTFIERLCLWLGLTKLPPHLNTLIIWLFIFTFVHLVAAPVLSQKYFPVAYGQRLRSRSGRNNWSIHVVSQVHTIVIVPLALWNIYNEPAGPVSRWERVFCWTDGSGTLHAIASAYFIWDTLDAIFNFTNIGFVLHGVACILVYTLSFRPFIGYYGRRCLLWETSTFFLNIHWFLDKTGRTGTPAQFYNGVLLISTFFLVRLVYGGRISYDFLCAIREIYQEIPLFYTIVYGSGNVVLSGLNYFWFSKMIFSFCRRFDDTKDVVHNNDEQQRLLDGSNNTSGPVLPN